MRTMTKEGKWGGRKQHEPVSYCVYLWCWYWGLSPEHIPEKKVPIERVQRPDWQQQNPPFYFPQAKVTVGLMKRPGRGTTQSPTELLSPLKDKYSFTLFCIVLETSNIKIHLTKIVLCKFELTLLNISLPTIVAIVGKTRAPHKIRVAETWSAKGLASAGIRGTGQPIPRRRGKHHVSTKPQE